MNKTLGLAVAFCFVFLSGGISQNSLFKKYKKNPVLNIGSSLPDWRAIHVANAAILTPDESPDKLWRLYVRGSGKTPEYHDQIGVLYQDTNNFSPYGPWLEYENNPVIPYGNPGTYDEQNLLDCAPVVGENGDVYFYYKAVNSNGTSTLAGARLGSDGLTSEKFSSNPLKNDVGANDAIYHNGQYYIYYGDGLYNRKTHRFDSNLEIYVKVTSDPENISDRDSIKVLGVGGGPGNFDSYSVNGARIFRLNNMWYMIYQGSNQHFDFPNRFHAAYSDDLINWTKVDNEFPLLMRGDPGDWDQGGIWFGEVFEYRDTLYMFYEGWGCYCIPEDRDEPYFPGNSRTGIASVSTSDFLFWVDGGFKPEWQNKVVLSGDTIVNFEDRNLMLFNSNNSMFYDVVNNPNPDNSNASNQSGRIITTTDQYELLYSEPLENRFDFSDGSVFTMKVFTETPGKVFFKIEHPSNYKYGQLEVKQELTTVNKWVDMEFDFSALDPQSELYGKIVLLFDAGGTAANNYWYFDDIVFNPEKISTGILSPNQPAANSFKIKRNGNHCISVTGMTEDDVYKIFSVNGRLLLNGTGRSIDIAGLKSGVYVLNVQDKYLKFKR
ncbi:hypothetical protein ACE01N_03405 [Saccharicrinis sp. FJH2]|uniref:hypothetical protein n=1 Tax=Saccharicrinis sp. FJH65 TaxID=3344659 RepID=UPI0035F342E3